MTGIIPQNSDVGEMMKRLNKKTAVIICLLIAGEILLLTIGTVNITNFIISVIPYILASALLRFWGNKKGSVIIMILIAAMFIYGYIIVPVLLL
jgi:hypothetical protein